MVQPFAGAAAFGAPSAQGQWLPMGEASLLFSIYGTVFGGNGFTAFALPDLRGRAAIGGTPGASTAQSLTMTAIIAAETTADSPLVGTVAWFGGAYAPPGWLVANGSTLSIDAFPHLFQVIGTTFGGKAGNTFDLPDLSGRAAVGTGEGPGLLPVALGQTVPGTVPGLGLTYLICTTGYYPVPDGSGGFPPLPFIGQVVAYAGAEAPSGWAVCDGSLLQVERYEPLFSLIGTTYGGQGAQTFALPDLRGRMLVGS
jgi:microcystin-dependent protein